MFESFLFYTRGKVAGKKRKGREEIAFSLQLSSPCLAANPELSPAAQAACGGSFALISAKSRRLSLCFFTVTVYQTMQSFPRAAFFFCSNMFIIIMHFLLLFD